MSSYSFGRVCRLTLTGVALTPDGGQEGPPNPDLREQVSFDSRVGADLRFTFDAQADDTGKPNQCKISIINLSPRTRSILTAGSRVTIEAGYTSSFGVVFDGFVSKIATHGDGPDVVTDLEAGDGEPFIRYGTCQLSYDKATPPITLAQIVADIAGYMGLTLDKVPLPQLTGPKAKAQMAARQFARGYAYSGGCADALNKLLPPAGLQWYVLHGTLHVVGAAEPIRQEAVVLSADTGMIGLPSRNENSVMVVNALIDPRITVGSLIDVQSKEPTQCGVFKVTKTQVQGDTHGGPWNVNIEAITILNVRLT